MIPVIITIEQDLSEYAILENVATNVGNALAAYGIGYSSITIHEKYRHAKHNKTSSSEEAIQGADVSAKAAQALD